MKLSVWVVLGVSLLYATVGSTHQAINSARPNQATLLKTKKDEVSYSLGADLGGVFKIRGLDIDPAVFMQGFRDGMQGTTILTQEQMNTTIKHYQQQLIAKQQSEFKRLSEQNKQQGNLFLAANKLKPGVKTTASGLQYKIINAGTGTNPGDKDTVTVEYTGRLIDGTVFDHSKEPVSFTVSEMIPGWVEVLKLMKPNARFEVFIPPNLAYGERGQWKAIGPNQTLLFNIHLLTVKQPDSKSVS